MVVRPASDASVAPAPPAGTHHVRSPTIPSAATPRSAWYAFTAASVFGPNAPSAAPGSAGVPGPPERRSAFCSAVTTAPCAPRPTCGVSGSAGSAFHVCGPTTPSAVRPVPDWKSRTAASVFGPNTPSIASKSSDFIITSRRCSRRTSLPVEPLRIVGPWFISSVPQGVDRVPRLRADDAVLREAAVALQRLHARLGPRAEDPVHAAGVVARQREPLLDSPHRQPRRPAAHDRMAEDGVLVDVEPRDGADDAVHRDPLLLLEGPDGRLGRRPELAVDRPRIVARLLERLLQLADRGPARAAPQHGFCHGSSFRFGERGGGSLSLRASRSR